MKASGQFKSIPENASYGMDDVQVASIAIRERALRIKRVHVARDFRTSELPFGRENEKRQRHQLPPNRSSQRTALCHVFVTARVARI